MNDEEYLNVLWEQFGIETAEHLENLENLLIELEYRAVETEELSSLFRSFHTVKGLSKSMELLAMEAVAHRCEDILGLVRDEGAPLQAETINILLEAMASLQTLRSTAVQDRADSSKPVDLIQQLETVYAALAQGLNLPIPETILETSPIAEPIESNVTPEDLPSTSPPSLILNIDPEILEFYAETLRNSLPDIAKLATQMQFGPDDNEIANTLDTLAFASENLEFDLVAQTFSQLKSMVEQTTPLSDEQQYEKLMALGHLPQMLLTLAEETQLDFGCDSFLNSIPQDLHQVLVEKLTQLQTQVNDFQTVFEQQEQDETLHSQIKAIFRESKSLLPYAQLLGNSSLTDILTGTFDIYQRAGDAIQSSGEGLSLNSELIELTQQSFALCIQLVSNAIEQNNESLDEQINTLFQQIQKNVMGESEQSDESSDTLQQLQDLGLHPEYFTLLSEEIIQQISEQVAQQHNLFLLQSPADMDESTACQFLVWLQSGVQVYTSRSIVKATTSDIEFFLGSQESLEVIQTQLGSMDNDQNILKLSALGASSEAIQEEAIQEVQVAPEAETAKTTEAPKTVKPKSPEKQAKKSSSQANKPGDKEQNLIRVNGAVLDQFMDQIGEMVLIRSQLNHLLHDEEISATHSQLKLAINNLKTHFSGSDEEFEQLERHVETILEHNHNLIQVDMQIHSTLNQLQEEVMELRVVPIENVFKRFPRVVRDLAKSQDKKVQFEMQGGDVRIDKGMVDLLVDPLMHMIRNSVDHGVEIPEQRQKIGKTAQAKLLLKANQRGNQVIIDIIDDGKGIDAEKIKEKIIARSLLTEPECQQLSDSEILGYIFEAGFSTAAKLTETSGRGVGLDVVKTVVNKLGGKIDLNSKPNEGTQFSMEFPLSAAIQNTLLIEVNQQIFAIPDRYVAEVIETPPEALQSIKGCKAILLRNVFLPIVYLGDLLRKNPPARTRENDLPVVVLSNGHHRIGIEVDKLFHRQELFIKELNPQLAALPGVGGASILGNGRVVLILDGEDLFTLGSQLNSGNKKVAQNNSQMPAAQVINQ